MKANIGHNVEFSYHLDNPNYSEDDLDYFSIELENGEPVVYDGDGKRVEGVSDITHTSAAVFVIEDGTEEIE